MTDWTAVRTAYLSASADEIRLPDVKMPVMPRCVNEFSKKSDDPNCNAQVLGHIVEADSGLTCQLLKNINSSAYGLRRPVTSPSHAIAALGIRRTKMFLINAALESALPVCDLKLIRLSDYWNVNLERAILARHIAKLLKADADLAYSAALLQDFLLPLLTNEHDSTYSGFQAEQERTDSDLIDLELSHFGWDHAEAAARVMVDWGFPDDLVCCVLLHHRGSALLDDADLGKTAAAAVAVASLIPDSLNQAPAGLSELVALNDRWPEFDLFQLAEEIGDELQKAGSDVASYTPLRDQLAMTAV